MKTILTVRNYIVSFYNRHEMLSNYILRLVMSFFLLLAIRGHIGFNTLLSQLWFIIGFSVVCAFVNVRFLVLVMAGYTALQTATLSIGVGISVLVVMAAMYLIYLRLESKYGFMVMLIPLLYIIRIPALAPILLAMVAPMGTIGTVIVGNIIYFMLHYVSINEAVITGYAATSEFTTASVFINGLFTYRELFSSTIIMILVFLAVHYVRKLNLTHASDFAAAVGAGLYIVLMLIVRMLLNTITFASLRIILIGTVVSLILAMIIEKFIIPLDYARAEQLEFEDSDYYYFVRAVPKIMLDRENVRVTRISGRKSESDAMAEEETDEGKEETD